MNKNMNQSRTNQNMSLSHTMNMKNLLTSKLKKKKIPRILFFFKIECFIFLGNHTNINMSLSHTMIMKPLITIPMSLMIITQSLR